MTILDRILIDKRAEVAACKEAVPLAELQRRVPSSLEVRSLADALARSGTASRVIAEVKKASPSKGLIREDFDPVEIARGYEAAGARGISVLTDEKYFQGRLEYLTAIREVVGIPILRKDFIVDPYQVWEARVAGADAILLILAAFRDDGALADLSALAGELGLDVLWEVHDTVELDRLLPLGPRIVGINNRDLRTFEVSLETTRSLLPRLPEGVVSVSESGFSRREELDQLQEWGVDAFLIGETLMRAPDPEQALRELLA